ncbi:hypothetical protein [Alistipes indistinctus]|uniref:hypothetical protein n=1 Tax=Alistipes indistinctus TaxID=626932 RepID=UPI003A8A4B5C
MKKLGLLFAVQLLAVCSAVGQETGPYENTTYIVWSVDRPLSEQDFLGDSTRVASEAMELFRKFDLGASASIGIWSVVDIPDKKLIRRGERQEHIYVVPLFEKTRSFIINDDTLAVKLQQVVFDIYEWTSRFMRKELQSFQDSMGGATGSQAVVYETIRNNCKKMRDMLVGQYSREVYIEKQEGAYDKWRKFIDGQLESLKEYATGEAEWQRFLKGEPILPDYVRVKNVISGAQSIPQREWWD